MSFIIIQKSIIINIKEEKIANKNKFIKKFK